MVPSHVCFGGGATAAVDVIDLTGLGPPEPRRAMQVTCSLTSLRILWHSLKGKTVSCAGCA